MKLNFRSQSTDFIIGICCDWLACWLATDGGGGRLIERTLEFFDYASEVQVWIAAGLDGGSAADERVFKSILAAGHQHTTLDGGRLRGPCDEDHVGARAFGHVVVDIGDGVSDIFFGQHFDEFVPLGVCKQTRAFRDNINTATLPSGCRRVLFDLSVSSPAALASLCRTMILVAFSLKPKSRKASFLPSLKLLKASMHSGSTLTPDDIF